MNIVKRILSNKSGSSMSDEIGSKLRFLVLTTAVGVMATGCGLPQRLPKIPSILVPWSKEEAKTVVESPSDGVGTVADLDRFYGIVSADEPQAALIARSILETGGNAADAATALYFALSVTYPGAASLGGGGMCLYRGPNSPQVEVIDFRPSSPARRGPIAVPGNIAGFANLHDRHGNLKWVDLVGPSGYMAGKGTVVSQALANQIDAAQDNRSAVETFDRTGKGKISVGHYIVQKEIATSIGLIQYAGEDGFYRGALGKAFVANAAKEGGTITEQDLRNYKVRVRLADMVSSSGLRVFTALEDERMRDVWTTALQGESLTDQLPENQKHIEAGTTSFLVIDARGRSVSCALTMNGAFGYGGKSRETGIFYALPSEGARNVKGAGYLTARMVNEILGSAGEEDTVYSYLAPVIALARPDGLPAFVGSSAGNQTAIEDVVEVLNLGAMSTQEDLSSALAESGSSSASPVNAMTCSRSDEGVVRECHYGADPRGNGLALEATRK